MSKPYGMVLLVALFTLLALVSAEGAAEAALRPKISRKYKMEFEEKKPPADAKTESKEADEEENKDNEVEYNVISEEQGIYDQQLGGPPYAARFFDKLGLGMSVNPSQSDVQWFKSLGNVGWSSLLPMSFRGSLVGSPATSLGNTAVKYLFPGAKEDNLLFYAAAAPGEASALSATYTTAKRAYDTTLKNKDIDPVMHYYVDPNEAAAKESSREKYASSPDTLSSGSSPGPRVAFTPNALDYSMARESGLFGISSNAWSVRGTLNFGVIMVAFLPLLLISAKSAGQASSPNSEESDVNKITMVFLGLALLLSSLADSSVAYNTYKVKDLIGTNEELKEAEEKTEEKAKEKSNKAKKSEKSGKSLEEEDDEEDEEKSGDENDDHEDEEKSGDDDGDDDDDHEDENKVDAALLEVFEEQRSIGKKLWK